MQKSEDVVILMNKNEIQYLVGSEVFEENALPIYSEIVCQFLDDLSKGLRNDVEAKNYPDILTFAFWCRKANITRMKEKYHTSTLRVGKGMVFHIAPSNVPINFAYSLAFGMLAGNGNVVRVSKKEFPQTKIVCRVMRSLLDRPEYEILRRQTQVVSYGHIREINDDYSMRCNMRVIWGGDATIQEIRQSPIGTRCTEITFADRFSFAIFDEQSIEQLTEEELMQLAEKFYNDTYLMDQNACSSPHLILWREAKNHQSFVVGRKKFWNALYDIAQKYDLPEKKVVDKYTMLCEKAVQMEEMQSLQQYTNLLYVVQLKEIPKSMDDVRGKFGLFYEMGIENIEDICDKISTKVQTCVTYGMDKEELLRIFVKNHVKGVDRIVEAGKAMDIGVDWDGYDVIGSLSRGIQID